MPTEPIVEYADDFSSYPIGSFPTGWIGGGARVDIDPLGFYNHILQIGTNQIAKDLSIKFTSATVYFAFCANSGTAGPYLFAFTNSGPALTNTTARIVSLTIESDLSLSLRGFGGVLIGNTGQYGGGIINPYGWNYVQINVTLSTFARAGDGATCMAATCDLGLNGNTMFTGASGEFPALPVSVMYYPEPIFNWWLFNDPNIDGGPLGNIFMCQLAEINLFPFDFTSGMFNRDSIHGTMSNALLSQGFLEAIEQKDIGDISDTNLRVSQGFIELMELPLIQANPLIEFPNLRISQVFIELVTENLTNPGSGKVYES